LGLRKKNWPDPRQKFWPGPITTSSQWQKMSFCAQFNIQETLRKTPLKISSVGLKTACALACVAMPFGHGIMLAGLEVHAFEPCNLWPVVPIPTRNSPAC